MRKNELIGGKFKIILFCLLISQFIFFSAQAEQIKIYAIPLNYDKGKISFGEIITQMGYLPPAAGLNPDKSQQYLIELVSFSKTVLESQAFSFSLAVAPPPPLPGEKVTPPTILEKASTLVVFPYHKDGKTLNVYDSAKKLILTKDIAYLSDMCGDDICQDQESYESCSKDCAVAAADDYCNTSELNKDPDCQKLIQINQNQAQAQKDNTAGTKSIFTSKLFYFILFILLLIILAAVYFIYKKRKDAGY